MGASRTQRGAATVELAVLLPLGVLLLTAGEWITELLAVRLKTREAARALAWDPAEAAVARTEHVYADFDSATERSAPAQLFARAAPITAHRERRAVTWEAPSTPLEADAAGRAATVAARVRSAPLSVAASLGLESPVMVRAHARTAIHLPRLGIALFRTVKPLLPRQLQLEETVALVLDDWASPDGADSRAQGGRTGLGADGQHTELWRRVDRMKFLGDRSALAPEVSLARAFGSVLPFVAPELDGTFVIDQSLRRGEGRRCEGVPGYPREALSGLRDFGDAVDPGAPKCFGTQPLRDTQEYAASLQLQVLRERGPHSLGCFDAEADDPSRTADADLTDANIQKRSCGGAR